jgi:hypothetical protein
MEVMVKQITLASIPDPPGMPLSAMRSKLRPFFSLELLVPKPLEFFAIESYDFAFALFVENLNTEMQALKHKDTLFPDCYPFLLYLLALNLHRPLIKKYLARIQPSSDSSDLLLKYRFATVLGDKRTRAATARQCLALVESPSRSSAAVSSEPTMRIAELGVLTNLMEIAFFENDVPRVRELASLFGKKKSELKHREAMRISSFYPLAIQKAAAFTKWLDARERAMYESEEAKEALRKFNQLISNPHSRKRFAHFFYRIYANWLRIEFAIECEPLQYFWLFFRHLIKGYPPAWQNVRHFPRPRRPLKVTLNITSRAGH